MSINLRNGLATIFGVVVGLAGLVSAVPVVRELLPSGLALEAETRIALAAQMREIASDGRVSVDERLGLKEWIAERELDEEVAEGYVAEIEPAMIAAARETREGLRLATQERFAEAVHRFTEATRLDATSAMAWANLGGAALELGSIADAEAASRRALGLDAESVAAHYNLGACLARQERIDVALDHLASAVDLILRDDAPRAIDRGALLADLRGSAHFASLRTSPRFVDLLQRLDDARR